MKTKRLLFTVHSLLWFEGSLACRLYSLRDALHFRLLYIFFPYIIHRSTTLSSIYVKMCECVSTYCALAKIHDQYLCK